MTATVRPIEHYLIAYAEKVMATRRDMGMTKTRLRDYLRACLDRWRKEYGDHAANAAEAAIRARWQSEK